MGAAAIYGFGGADPFGAICGRAPPLLHSAARMLVTDFRLNAALPSFLREEAHLHYNIHLAPKF